VTDERAVAVPGMLRIGARGYLNLV